MAIPKIWTRLRNEIRTKFNSDEEITGQSTATLPFLDAVIHESPFLSVVGLNVSLTHSSGCLGKSASGNTTRRNDDSRPLHRRQRTSLPLFLTNSDNCKRANLGNATQPKILVPSKLLSP